MDYNVLRKIVAGCVRNVKGDESQFRINLNELTKRVKELGLIPVLYKNDYISKSVTVDDIIVLAEFFKEDKLQWFDGDRSFEFLTFIREEDIDDNLQNLLQDLSHARLNEIDENSEPCRIKPIGEQAKDSCCRACKQRVVDAKSTFISIISAYPCYTTVIAKWVKKDSISLNIRFRANSLLINAESEK